MDRIETIQQVLLRDWKFCLTNGAIITPKKHTKFPMVRSCATERSRQLISPMYCHSIYYSSASKTQFFNISTIQGPEDITHFSCKIHYVKMKIHSRTALHILESYFNLLLVWSKVDDYVNRRFNYILVSHNIRQRTWMTLYGYLITPIKYLYHC